MMIIIIIVKRGLYVYKKNSIPWNSRPTSEEHGGSNFYWLILQVLCLSSNV